MWYLAGSEVTPPIDLNDFSKHNKKMAKEKRTIVDFLKDYFIPHVMEMKTWKEMYDALVMLY